MRRIPKGTHIVVTYRTVDGNTSTAPGVYGGKTRWKLPTFSFTYPDGTVVTIEKGKSWKHHFGLSGFGRAGIFEEEVVDVQVVEDVNEQTVVHKPCERCGLSVPVLIAHRKGRWPPDAMVCAACKEVLKDEGKESA